MRALLVVAILSLAILAGCFGKGGEEDDHYTCADGTEIHSDDYPAVNNTTDLAKYCPKKNGTNGTNSTSNSTSRAPNVLPTLVFTTKLEDGTVSNSTMLNGNLTFDASGSMDSDGNITGLAASVTDSNQTRTLTLFDPATKAFTPKTISFDRAGRVNVTVAIVDDRGGFTTLNTVVFVDETKVVGQSFQGTVGTAQDGFPLCGGPIAGTPVGTNPLDAAYYQDLNFPVVDDAGWIEAVATGGVVTICTPRTGGEANTPGEALSEQGDEVVTDGTPIPAAVGIASYYLGGYKTGAPGDLSVTVTVHYGPKPAA